MTKYSTDIASAYTDLLEDGRLMNISRSVSSGYNGQTDTEVFTVQTQSLPVVGPLYGTRTVYGNELAASGYSQGTPYTAKSGYAGYTRQNMAYMLVGCKVVQSWYPQPNDIIAELDNSAKWIIKSIDPISPDGTPIILKVEVEQ